MFLPGRGRIRISPYAEARDSFGSLVDRDESSTASITFSPVFGADELRDGNFVRFATGIEGGASRAVSFSNQANEEIDDRL